MEWLKPHLVKFRFDIGKMFFTWSIAGQWNWLPRIEVTASSLTEFQEHLHTTLRFVMWFSWWSFSSPGAELNDPCSPCSLVRFQLRIFCDFMIPLIFSSTMLYILCLQETRWKGNADIQNARGLHHCSIVSDLLSLCRLLFCFWRHIVEERWRKISKVYSTRWKVPRKGYKFLVRRIKLPPAYKTLLITVI